MIRSSPFGETKMRSLNLITLLLVIVGGLNWLLVGLFNFDLVAALFGVDPAHAVRLCGRTVGALPVDALLQEHQRGRNPRPARLVTGGEFERVGDDASNASPLGKPASTQRSSMGRSVRATTGPSASPRAIRMPPPIGSIGTSPVSERRGLSGLAGQQQPVDRALGPDAIGERFGSRRALARRRRRAACAPCSRV